MSGSSTKDIPTDVAEAWQELCEKDDRTSPAEHPDMCLITRDELLGYMSLASAEDERRGIAEIRMDERHKYLWQVRDTCTRAEAAEAALKAAREALEPCAEFVRWAARIAWEGGDIDGGTIQEKLLSLGLIRHARFDPDVHGPHPDAVYGDPFYVFHDELKESAA